MERASRIVSVLLGLVVAVFILWPITIPVGFGQAWWASKQIAAQSEPTPSPRPDAPADPAAAPSPPFTPLANTAPSETSTQSTPAKPDEGKHALLAAERAEAERIAALNKNAKTQNAAPPAAPPTATKLYYRVVMPARFSRAAPPSG